MVICLERDADLHMAQMMPLPLTVSCFSKIQIGFTFLVPAHLGSPGKRAVKRVCVCGYCKVSQGNNEKNNKDDGRHGSENKYFTMHCVFYCLYRLYAYRDSETYTSTCPQMNLNESTSL